MASEWFYTTNKQQMGPVSWKELAELAEVGILKPHDMVWTEGMDEWVKAVNQKGLFGAGAEAGMKPASKKSSYAEPKPPPGRRSKAAERDDEEDEEDEKEAKRAARKAAQDRTKMAMGAKVGLILGGGLLVVLVGVGCIGGMIYVSFAGGGKKDGGGQQVVQPYTINNLQQGQHDQKQFNFRQNQRVQIAVNFNMPNPNMNVALMVFRGNDLNNPIQRVNQFNRNARVDFVIPGNDVYFVRVANLGQGMVNSANVNIDVR